MCTEDSTITIFKNYVVINACTGTAGTLNKNTGPLISIDGIIIDIGQRYENMNTCTFIINNKVSFNCRSCVLTKNTGCTIFNSKVGNHSAISTKNNRTKTAAIDNGR